MSKIIYLLISLAILALPLYEMGYILITCGKRWNGITKWRTNKLLTPDEQIIIRARKSFVGFVAYVLFSITFLACLYLYLFNPALPYHVNMLKLSVFFLVGALFTGAGYYLSDIVVTNKRILLSSLFSLYMIESIMVNDIARCVVVNLIIKKSLSIKRNDSKLYCQIDFLSNSREISNYINTNK